VKHGDVIEFSSVEDEAFREKSFLAVATILAPLSIASSTQKKAAPSGAAELN
jgi:hypothetical protein